MPQKPVLKAGKKIEKKKQAANRHGKQVPNKKGNFEKAPKSPKELKQFLEAKELTKTINRRNENGAAGHAQQAGGQLKVVKPPPVLAPKDQQQKKGKDQAAAMDVEEDEQDSD